MIQVPASVSIGTLCLLSSLVAVAFGKSGKLDLTLPPIPKLLSRSPSLAKTEQGNTIKTVKVRTNNLSMQLCNAVEASIQTAVWVIALEQ
jgi:hypothetical protein